MSSISIYVEGDGNGKGGRAALRRGMDAFLEAQKQTAQSRGWRWKLTCAGSRNETFGAFRNATRRRDWGFGSRGLPVRRTIPLDVAKRPARAHDLDAVVEPRQVDRGIRRLVGPVHHGVAHELAQRVEGVRGAANFRCFGPDFHGSAYLTAHRGIEVSYVVLRRTIEPRIVDDRVGTVRACEPNELDMRRG